MVPACSLTGLALNPTRTGETRHRVQQTWTEQHWFSETELATSGVPSGLSQPARSEREGRILLRAQNKTCVACEALLRLWYGKMRLPPQSTPSWYRDRLREEAQERRLVRKHWQKLSETSDVLFAISRARYDGILTCWQNTRTAGLFTGLPPFSAAPLIGTWFVRW